MHNLRVRPTRGDLIAGLSVALVLIPQSFAYATLAGMPAERGLLVAVVATIAAAPLASSAFLQTGPVAVTALLTFGALQGLAPTASQDYIQLGMLLAVLVGGIRLAVGLLREGDLAYLLSRSVLAGFTPAAALLIVASQLPSILGVEGGGHLVVRAVRSVAAVGRWDLTGLAMAFGTIVVLLVARRRWPLVPSVVVVVVLGIVATRVLGYEGTVVGVVPGVQFGVTLGLPWDRVGVLLAPAMLIALVGFGDVAAVSRLYAAETRSRWDADREFVSQGAANLASGIFGGFPAGGSFARSGLAKAAGATTPWSGALAGLAVLGFLPFVDLLGDLPMAVLAGIIVASVSSLLDVREMRELRQLSRPQFLIAASTALLTLVLTPQIQWALLAGVAMSVAWHLRRETVVTVDAHLDGDVLHLRPSGVLYFGSVHLLEATFRSILAEATDVRAMVIHCDRLGRVDVNGALGMRDLAEEAARVGISTTVQDFGPAGRTILQRTLPAEFLA